MTIEVSFSEVALIAPQHSAGAHLLPIEISCPTGRTPLLLLVDGTDRPTVDRTVRAVSIIVAAYM